MSPVPQNEHQWCFSGDQTPIPASGSDVFKNDMKVALAIAMGVDLSHMQKFEVQPATDATCIARRLAASFLQNIGQASPLIF